MALVSTAALLASCSVFAPICTLTVALRFYARNKQQLPLLGDDWTMLAALIFFLAFQASVIVLVKIRWLGYQVDTVPVDQVKEQYFLAQKIIIASDVLLILSLGLIKISALVLYQRIFCIGGSVSRTLTRIIYGSIVFITCWIAAFLTVDGVQATIYFGNNYIGDGKVKHHSIGNLYILALFISDLCLDIWTVAIPVLPILQLRLGINKKLITIAIFLCALTGVAASAIRLEYFAVVVASNPHTVQMEGGQTVLHFYMILECGMLMISINAPVLWILFYKTKDTIKHGVTALRSYSTYMRDKLDVVTSRNNTTNASSFPNTPTTSIAALTKPMTNKSQVLHYEFLA